jgi:hypothetical protein
MDTICQAVCKSGKNKNTRCTYKSKPNSKYCGVHRNYVVPNIQIENEIIPHTPHIPDDIPDTPHVIPVDTPDDIPDTPVDIPDTPDDIPDTPHVIPVDTPDDTPHNVIENISSIEILKEHKPVLSIKRIYMLYKFVRLVISRYRTLTPVNYNNTIITYSSIFNTFIKTKKERNDESNKKRESIIGAIINEYIPNAYYKYSPRWKYFRGIIIDSIYTLYHQTNKDEIKFINCKHKGGRNTNYDFIFNVNNVSYNVEFKFNVSTIEQTPQFVSPMKPSQYLSRSYEEYYYDKYIPMLAKSFDIEAPTKDKYMKQIHSISPKCMAKFKTRYKRDNKLCERAKSLSKKSINEFITMADLNMEELSRYLKNSQKSKIYLMFKDNTFHLKTIDMDNYEIISYVKSPTTSSYIATTKTGRKLKILLRWKNGNGIAFPAFQISLLK